MSIDLELLRQTDLFQGLTPDELGKITGISAKESHEAGAVVFEEGQTGERFYLILKGEVRISKLIPGVGEEALVILKKGSYFGEMSLIDNQPRSAHAICNKPSELMVIERADFEKLLQKDKELAYKLLWTFLRTLSRRLRETNDKIMGFFAMTGPFK
ncbi:MAG TPA: cyclic nucleotide-binding domain-containing protein [bacterium]|nr:cyclic nucleotide-binding domain-containing protein [bacterium]